MIKERMVWLSNGEKVTLTEYCANFCLDRANSECWTDCTLDCDDEPEEFDDEDEEF